MSDVLLSFRGRQIREADAAFLRELIAQNPGLSRRRLSVKVCQAWNWVSKELFAFGPTPPPSRCR